MEQSKVEPAVVSESFVSDKEWFKATFSFESILTALRSFVNEQGTT